MKKTLIFLIILLAIPALANAFSITFINNTKDTMLVRLYWDDHDFPNWPYPVQMACGEIKAGENWDLETDYKPGTYRIIWRKLRCDKCEKKKYRLVLSPDEKHVYSVISTPGKMTVKAKRR